MTGHDHDIRGQRRKGRETVLGASIELAGEQNPAMARFHPQEACAGVLRAAHAGVRWYHAERYFVPQPDPASHGRAPSKSAGAAGPTKVSTDGHLRQHRGDTR